MDVYMYDEVRVLIAPQPYSQPLHVDGQAVGLRDMRGDDEMTDCEGKASELSNARARG